MFRSASVTIFTSNNKRRMQRAACVQVRIGVRRVMRHPISQKTLRSGVLLRKHVVRGATLSLVPDAVNDVAFHHAQLNLDELIHVIQDTASISSMTAVLAATLIILRVGSD
jgi:hypothetical protein